MTNGDTYTENEQLLAANLPLYFHIHPETMSALGGYSNQNISIAAGGKSYVVRISRRNRGEASVRAEEHVLNALAQKGYPFSPRLVKDFSPPLRLNNRFVHLFHTLPGKIDCLWWQQCSEDKLKQIFTGLATLHQKMKTILSVYSGEGQYVWYRLPDKVPAHISETNAGQFVTENWSAFKNAANKLQHAISDFFPWENACYQWIHGDVQLENVLFDNNVLSGFLDFEMVRWDACEKDVILSAFRTCKEGNTDASFQYDAARCKIALDTYLSANTGLNPAFFDRYDTLWKPFFCLDQAMVYLQNAFDGVWKLEDNIGFIPCFKEVLQYYEW